MRRNLLLHKCTATYRLVSSLQDLVAVARASNSYPKWSDDFLFLSERLADATLRHLKVRIQECRQTKGGEQLLTSQSLSLMQGWEVLHTFIKPVADANALKVPYPFIHFLSDYIGGLDAVREARIVIELVPELNYLQHRHTRLKDTMRFLRTIVTREQSPEPRRGFLGLPCSQSKSLFMNCLLFHEAGHFIAEEAHLFSRKELDQLTAELCPQFGPYASWAGRTVLIWMEELFADLVAVRLIGPAYSFAYLELLRLVSDLNPKGVRAFDPDHPADTLRFREQLKVLQDDTWRGHIKAAHWADLARMAKTKEEDYTPPREGEEEDPDMQKVWRELMRVLCQKKRMRKVQALARKYVKGRGSPRQDYLKSASVVRECLEHGIVPSVTPTGGKPVHPIAIINGAIFFWLDGMTSLYSKFEKKSVRKNRVEDRAKVEQRVELWSIKAIEDWLASRE